MGRDHPVPQEAALGRHLQSLSGHPPLWEEHHPLHLSGSLRRLGAAEGLVQGLPVPVAVLSALSLSPGLPGLGRTAPTHVHDGRGREESLGADRYRLGPHGLGQEAPPSPRTAVRNTRARR